MTQTETILREPVRASLTLRSRLQALLANYIFDGRFKGGDRLIERELCELTGASRPAIREALVYLESRGLLERQSFRGFRVVSLSVGKISEIFELRMVLETFAAELFVERASDEELARLEGIFFKMERSVKKYDRVRLRELKYEYYEALFIGARNPELWKALDSIVYRVFYLRSRLLSNADRRKASIEEFRALTSALLTRNKPLAREASLIHLKNARDALVAQIVESGASGTVR